MRLIFGKIIDFSHKTSFIFEPKPVIHCLLLSEALTSIVFRQISYPDSDKICSMLILTKFNDIY